MKYQIVVASSFWTLSGVNVFAANLVRGLRAQDISAHILLTEQNTDIVNITEPEMPIPPDVPMARLPVQRDDGWGAHWGAMIRYLEDRAPCIYIPNSDWRHSCVCPLLSPGVSVVGVVHSDDPMHYDHVRRLGKYWDAIVAVSKAVADVTVAADPSLASRIRTIPIGVPMAGRLPERPPDNGAPLRIVYHGLLNQHQKRILDFPAILAALEGLGVPFVLTLAGGGHQAGQLREACRAFEEKGTVCFTGVLGPQAVQDLLATQDVFLMTSEFEGMPNALLEAMGRGCIPVVTRTRSGIPEVVKDGENGYLLPVGDVHAFAERLAILHKDLELRKRLSESVYATATAGPYSVGSMIKSYAALFHEIMEQANRFQRPSGPISLPPREVGGIGIFPVECSHVVEGVGAFASLADFLEFDESRAGRCFRNSVSARRSAHVAALEGVRVIVALPYWTLTGVTVFAANLVRGLCAAGVNAEILLSEQSTDLVTIPDALMPFPEGIPIRQLPVGRRDGWGTRWARMIRVLEEAAPCIYLPNYDWRQSCVGPLLSPDVNIIGILHGDDPLHYDHLLRQGSYWDAIVGVSSTIVEEASRLRADCMKRMVRLPYGVAIPSRCPGRTRADGTPLRLIYHGVLNTRQKRILDLPKIVEAVSRRGVPVELTIVGDGPEKAELEAACKPLIERGQIRMRGVLPNERILELLEQHDVYLMTSGFEGLPNALLEAMGRGCVPVVTAIKSGIPDLVVDGYNGYLVPIGDIEAFAEKIALLEHDQALIADLSRQAHHTVHEGSYRTEQMVDAYMALFAWVIREARQGSFQRPKGLLLPPAASVNGVNLFPVECVEIPGAGRFPVHPRGQWKDFRREVRLHALGKISWRAVRSLEPVLHLGSRLRKWALAVRRP